VIFQAVIALGEMRDSTAAPVLGDVYHAKHKDPHLNSSALTGLVSICNPSSQPVFIEALSSADGYEQDQAASGLLCTLNKQPNPDAVEPLLKLLATQAMFSVIHASGATKDPRAYEPLVRILNAPDRDVRRWGVEALGGLGDKRAVGALGALLKDADSSVRISAAGALSEMSDYPAPKELLEAVHDEDTNVQHWAASALGSSHDSKAVDALLAAASYNVWAIGALGQSKNPRAVAPLIAILQDKARKAGDRESAAQALGNLGDIRAVDALIGVLNENDAQLLMSAAQALGKLHDKNAIEPLKQLIERWKNLPSGQQGTGAVETFAYAALRELGVDASRRVTGNPPQP
jgi:HEAT repeat protein